VLKYARLGLSRHHMVTAAEPKRAGRRAPSLPNRRVRASSARHPDRSRARRVAGGAGAANAGAAAFLIGAALTASSLRNGPVEADGPWPCACYWFCGTR
jgi:hypothetical protein